MWRAYFAVVLAGILISVIAGLVLWAHSDPSTVILDQDIARLQGEIKEASDDEAKYSGGLIVGLIRTRSEILQVTETMLQAKKLSWLRRANLTFTVEGRVREPQTEMLAKIESDLHESDRRLADAEEKAQQYTGGLVQGLALVGVATERVTHSQLLLAYYSAKYGLVPPIPRPDQSNPKPKPEPNIVKDKEGL